MSARWLRQHAAFVTSTQTSSRKISGIRVSARTERVNELSGVDRESLRVAWGVLRVHVIVCKTDIVKLLGNFREHRLDVLDRRWCG